VIGVLVGIIIIIMASLVNDGQGVAHYLGGGRPETWLFNLVVFGGMLLSAGRAINNRWFGVLIDRDCRMSLSRLQLVTWTMLLVSALLTMGLTNVEARGIDPATQTQTPPIPPPASGQQLTPPPPTGQAQQPLPKPAPPPGPLDINIPAQIWALLGLGALTAVSAPAIKNGKRAPNADPLLDSFDQDKAIAAVQSRQKIPDAALMSYDGAVLVKGEPKDARWSDLIIGDYQGAAFVDISKLQQLAFTALIVVVYGGSLWLKFNVVLDPKGLVIPLHDFPDVSNGLLALLGISHATYLADKQVGDT
jgi:hypothetical protein